MNSDPLDKELQVYRDNNVEVSGGTAKLIAKDEVNYWYSGSGGFTSYNYTSGMIHSKEQFIFLYGKYQIRCKIPSGRGFWPAFWVVGNGELDVFEFSGHKPKDHWTDAHNTCTDGNNCHHSIKHVGLFQIIPKIDPLSHIFELEWDPAYVIWRVDGQQIRKISRYYAPSSGNPLDCSTSIVPGFYDENVLVPSHPWNKSFIIANLAIIGPDGPFGPPPNSSTPFDSQMEIDYIRVYQKQYGKIIGDDLICSGQHTYQFSSGMPQNSPSWSTSSNLNIVSSSNDDITVQVTSTGPAWIQVVDDDGYTFTKDIWIGTYNSSVLDINGPSEACPNDYVYLQGVISGFDPATITDYDWTWPSGWTYLGGDGTPHLDLRAPSNTYSWSSDILLNVENQCGWSGTPEVQIVSPKFYGCSGGYAFSMGPNPGSTYIDIEVEKKPESTSVDVAPAYEVEIYNVHMKKYKKVTVGKNTKRKRLDISRIPQGQYIVRIRHGANVINKRLVIDRK